MACTYEANRGIFEEYKKCFVEVDFVEWIYGGCIIRTRQTFDQTLESMHIGNDENVLQESLQKCSKHLEIKPLRKCNN